MAVVRHQRVAQIRIGTLVPRFPQDAYERLVIRRLLEQLHTRNAAIQYVKDYPSPAFASPA